MPATPADFPWANIIGNLGVVGALVWYLYYNTTFTLPNMQSRFEITLDKIATRSDEAVAAEREECHARMQSLAGEVRELREKMLSFHPNAGK